MRLKFEDTFDNGLIASRDINVRFSEVDAMGIVWHGNYLKYFEDGREAFGDRFDLDFVKLYHKEGYLTPLVKVDIEYKRMLKLGEKAVVEARFVPTEAAKIVFDYRILHSETRQVLTLGRTVQVFVKEDELAITIPDFFQEWKTRWLNKNDA